MDTETATMTSDAPVLDMATIGKAFGMLTEGFALLGFKNLEVPGHLTSENYQGVYLVAHDAREEDGEDDVAAAIRNHMWLRISIAHGPEGKFGRLDFKAGPDYWLGITGKPDTRFSALADEKEDEGSSETSD